jgi:uncharacterized membrane protein YphA (DoxX/SURF4 family)
MSFLRFAARSMLASYFVINGVKAVRTPSAFADEAAPVADKVLPAVRGLLPSEAAGFLPTDATGVARILGLAQIAGGLSLATGLGRRCGAGLLALTMVPRVVSHNPTKPAADDRSRLGTDVALLGGVVLAAMDTEGRPNLAWRVNMHRQLAVKDIDKRKAELAKAGQSIAVDTGKRARKLRKQVEEVLS